jgi:hypothetical protein
MIFARHTITKAHVQTCMQFGSLIRRAHTGGSWHGSWCYASRGSRKLVGLGFFSLIQSNPRSFNFLNAKRLAQRDGDIISEGALEKEADSACRAVDKVRIYSHGCMMPFSFGNAWECVKKKHPLVQFGSQISTRCGVLFAARAAASCHAYEQRTTPCNFNIFLLARHVLVDMQKFF